MKELWQIFKKIYKEQRGLLILMVFNFLLSLVLFLIAVFNLDPSKSVVKVGYGDIGGYRDGAWSTMLVFPVIAFLFGIAHNFLAVRLYEKKGEALTKVFVAVTTLLIIGSIVVLRRLLGEG